MTEVEKIETVLLALEAMGSACVETTNVLDRALKLIQAAADRVPGFYVIMHLDLAKLLSDCEGLKATIEVCSPMILHINEVAKEVDG